ncbi:alpha-1,6-mannosyl-glycoprotein 2-beta-N-acetylglucosaminyltransferase [Typha latifolia]|uniref:alpha-1,6-mannosyl-glycoprotein 2-beta-N-acetylglucosaminyltransferase n=1 Tax=Typha latifolia TaxID=4733 RepID=UPI003C2AD33E
MALHRRNRMKDSWFRRACPLVLVIVSAVLVIIFFLRSRVVPHGVQISPSYKKGENPASEAEFVVLDSNFKPKLPKQNEVSLSLEQRNRLPPRNLDRFPNLAKDHITIVLYVHNRPQYLQVVVKSLSQVEGIGETLLIVSHDGYFSEMDEIIRSIKFCQVKQIFAPYSPHLFTDSFPGVSPGDCRDKDDPLEKKCKGNKDQYGNHRSPKIVSLKHHWWWMMNTIWDGLKETKRFAGHILFIEEDHYIFPNAYRTIQLLTELKPRKCPECCAVNLAPSDVNSKGEGWASLMAEKVGNIGYAFNRTIWRKIHAKAKEFCSFDEYNWDITMWATVYPSFGSPVYSLRGPRRSAAHFGKCGLHQGQGLSTVCVDNSNASFNIDEIDRIPNIKSDWPVHIIRKQSGYQAGFKGWGGWGDERDRELCLSFAYMYHVKEASSG